MTRSLLLGLSLTSWFIAGGDCALFGTRGGEDQNDDEETGDQRYVEILDAVIDPTSDEVVSSFKKNSQMERRQQFVESFFAGDDSVDLQEELRKKVQNITNFLVQTRRALHRHPELMYQEKETSTLLQRALRELDIEFTTGWAVNTHQDVMPGKGGYGIVADIGTGEQPCVLLRADIDALPIIERTEGIEDFKSQNEGKMHACGHDGHQTMLLGAAALLKDMEDSINGTVRVIFQPAEEGGAGAKRMREEGLLNIEPKPLHAFGLHVWPTLPSGTIASRPGPILAAADMFEILVAGVGGHAAMPHLAVDPIVTASAIVMNLQTLVSRRLSPLESGVCSVTKIEAGDAFNVIPHATLMRGTIRALSTETLLMLREKVEHVVRSTADVYGCNVTIDWSPDFYPPTVNDPDLFQEFSRDVGAIVSPEGMLRDIEPTMGGEDFSFIADTLPSTFFLLGQGSGTDPPTNYGLHHPHFALDESVMPIGVELHVSLALRALRMLDARSRDK